MGRVTSRRTRLVPFLGWLVVGLLAAGGLAAAFTSWWLAAGPVGLALAALLVWRTGWRREIWAVLCGVALPLLVVAWLNRAGPGEVCTVRGDASACVTAWSPWPWAVAGAVVLMAGLVLALRRSPVSGRGPGALPRAAQSGRRPAAG
jgi:hypothetical protein